MKLNDNVEISPTGSGSEMMIKIQIANVPDADRKFIAQVIALFTDPARSEMLDRLRKGEGSIHFRKDGTAAVLPNFIPN